MFFFVYIIFANLLTNFFKIYYNDKQLQHAHAFMIVICTPYTQNANKYNNIILVHCLPVT